MWNEDKSWLQSLKAGDEVARAFSGGWGSPSYDFCQVTKVTATQIVVGSQRFNKQTGREVGSGSYFLKPSTDELKNEIKKEKRRNYLIFVMVREIRWSGLEDETLEQIYSILDSAGAIKKEA